MFLDIGIGILVSILAGELFDVSLAPLLIGVGIIFALLPDLDIIVDLTMRVLRKRKRLDHREVWHYPLIFIPSVALLIYLVSSPIYVFMFVMITLLHFLHDSMGIGWGVYWLYPFSDKRYSFIYQYDVFKHKFEPKKLVYSWTPQEVQKLSDEFGDPKWIKTIYFKLHPYALAEIIFFLAALLILYLQLIKS